MSSSAKKEFTSLENFYSCFIIYGLIKSWNMKFIFPRETLFFMISLKNFMHDVAIVLYFVFMCTYFNCCSSFVLILVHMWYWNIYRWVLKYLTFQVFLKSGEHNLNKKKYLRKLFLFYVIIKMNSVSGWWDT